MIAAINKRYGPPENIQIIEVSDPVPKKDEILIGVKASSVNRTDCGFLRAKPFITRFFSGLRKPRHPILGCEFAGEVIAVGSDVRLFTVVAKEFAFATGWKPASLKLACIAAASSKFIPSYAITILRSGLNSPIVSINMSYPFRLLLDIQ